MTWTLRVEDLSKTYHLYQRPLDRLREVLSLGLRHYAEDLHALHDINFEVEAGSTVGLVGRNGAGKSTLLKIISGNLAPSTGKVRVRGRVSSILELGLGFQPGLTGRQNIRINALLLGLLPHEIESCIPEVAEFSELGPAIERPISTYSSGMTARLAFSILTAVEADIIVLDEALAAGDVGFVAKGNKLIHKFRDSGATVLVVSHDMRVIKEVCDRAIWIDQGRIRADGVAEQVVEEYLRAVPDIAARFAPAAPPPEDQTLAPIRLTFRLHASNDGADLELPLVAAGWQERESGDPLGKARPPQDSHFEESVRGVRLSGLDAETARRGWGGVDVIHGVPARRFSMGSEGSYLSLLAPQRGRGPIDLFITFFDTKAGEVIVELSRAGEALELGRIATKGDGEQRTEVFPLPDDCRFDTLLPPEVEESCAETTAVDSAG